MVYHEIRVRCYDSPYFKALTDGFSRWYSNLYLLFIGIPKRRIEFACCRVVMVSCWVVIGFPINYVLLIAEFSHISDVSYDEFIFYLPRSVYCISRILACTVAYVMHRGWGV
ncbi:hypothetical protein HOY80DRAFT_532994 [Tuber brumale]|nr:hypothetical protein HOY80DRAFT_532994 [Tuber brumale]